MKIIKVFHNKLLNHFRQFGLFATLMRLLKVIIRPIIRINKNIVLAISDHQPDKNNKFPEIKNMTIFTVDKAEKKGELNKIQAQMLRKFLSEGCQGFIAYVDNNLAGYSFIQKSGIYLFSHKGRFKIPENMFLLKNLFVFPKYRGKSIGKKLNQIRISSIPKDKIPIVFVTSDNTYAIRNLKVYGFCEFIVVRVIIWFAKWSSQKVIKLYYENNLSKNINEGFKTALNVEHSVN